MENKGPQIISRRTLLRRAGAAGAAAAAGAAGVPAGAEAPPAAAATAPPAGPAPGSVQAPRPDPPRAAYEQLTAEEADLLEAIADELIPSDDLGPGAVAAGAVVYIDRALGGALSESRNAYRAGLSAFDRYCRASRGAPFRELPHVDRVSALIDVETGAATGARTGFAGSSAGFFNMVRSHVLQGTFGDPHYGGNRGFVGWGPDRLSRREDGRPAPAADAARGRRAAGEPPVRLRVRVLRQGGGPRRARGDPPWRLGCREPTSSSWGSARPAAWPRSPWPRPGST